MPTYKFPENFKWGSTTSAYQVEGDNHNDWSEWEKAPARLEQLKKEGKNPVNFISGKACDSYNKYEDDFDIAKKLNQNIHRFSIEWSRIEPEEGKFNEKEIQHYLNVVKSLRDRGLEPMITLWHFTNPVWFAEKGGWLNPKAPGMFLRFIKVVVPVLKSQVRLWITFNEATTVYGSHAYLKGLWPPHSRSILKWKKVRENIVRAHIEAYKEIKKIYNQSPVGSFNEVQPQIFKKVEPRDPNSMSHNVEVGISENNTYSVNGNNFYERMIGKIYNYQRNLYLWTRSFPYYDFMGLNYYHIDRIAPGSYKILPKQSWWMKDKGWELYSQGIYHALKQLEKFNKPIYITENGTSEPDDMRRKFIKEHLRWVWQAIQDGVDVKGYLYWSLLDNFEIDHGFKSRFGLVEVDYKTFERHIRPSAWEYAKICQTNSLEL